jgi:two-component system NtrC family sensor kinase
MMMFPIKMSEYSKEVKARYITPFSVILTVMGFLNWYIYYFIYKSMTLGLICLICSLAAMLIPFIKQKAHYHLLVANFVVILFFIGTTFLAAFTGGIMSNAIWWLGTIPLVASFLMNSFFGISWFVIIMADFLLVYYLGKNDFLPNNFLLSAAPEGRLIISFTMNASVIAFLCILADLIRDRAFLEKEELRLKTFQLSQLASLGKMASSVAHEINNPLTVIRGTQMRVQRMIDTEGPVDKIVLSDYLSKLQRNILRIQDVTHLLGTISEKARDRTISSINLKSMMEDIIQMRTEDIHRYNITLITQFPEEPLHFTGIFTELFQAILVVFENAVFELKESPNLPKTLKIELTSTEKKIRLQIEDNGEGIPIDLRPRIFDPFYKANSFDDKKGLALSFSYNVLNSNGGALELINSAQGTHFQIILPKA